MNKIKASDSDLVIPIGEGGGGLEKMEDRFRGQEPILRLLNLQLQRQRCRRMERFFKVEENFFVCKTR
jgi:hypothetical protein